MKAEAGDPWPGFDEALPSAARIEVIPAEAEAGDICLWEQGGFNWTILNIGTYQAGLEYGRLKCTTSAREWYEWRLFVSRKILR